MSREFHHFGDKKFRDSTSVVGFIVAGLLVLTVLVSFILLVTFRPFDMSVFTITFVSLGFGFAVSNWAGFVYVRRAKRKMVTDAADYRTNREAETQKKIDEMHTANSRIPKVKK